MQSFADKLWCNPPPQTSRVRNILSPFSCSAQLARVKINRNNFFRARFSGGLLDNSAAIPAGLVGDQCSCKTCSHPEQKTGCAISSYKFNRRCSHKSAAGHCSQARACPAGCDMDFARELGDRTQNWQAAPDHRFADDNLRHRLNQWRDGSGHWQPRRDLERN